MGSPQRLLRRKVIQADKLPDGYKRLTLECGHVICQMIHKKIPKAMVCHECPSVPVDTQSKSTLG
jgi:hypothetical protein